MEGQALLEDGGALTHRKLERKEGAGKKVLRVLSSYSMRLGISGGVRRNEAESTVWSLSKNEVDPVAGEGGWDVRRGQTLCVYREGDAKSGKVLRGGDRILVGRRKGW